MNYKGIINSDMHQKEEANFSSNYGFTDSKGNGLCQLLISYDLVWKESYSVNTYPQGLIGIYQRMEHHVALA